MNAFDLSAERFAPLFGGGCRVCVCTLCDDSGGSFIHRLLRSCMPELCCCWIVCYLREADYDVAVSSLCGEQRQSAVA